MSTQDRDRGGPKRPNDPSTGQDKHTLLVMAYLARALPGTKGYDADEMTRRGVMPSGTYIANKKYVQTMVGSKASKFVKLGLWKKQREQSGRVTYWYVGPAVLDEMNALLVSRAGRSKV